MCFWILYYYKHPDQCCTRYGFEGNNEGDGNEGGGDISSFSNSFKSQFFVLLVQTFIVCKYFVLRDSAFSLTSTDNQMKSTMRLN